MFLIKNKENKTKEIKKEKSTKTNSKTKQTKKKEQRELLLYEIRCRMLIVQMNQPLCLLTERLLQS
jgi:hypothetical protein